MNGLEVIIRDNLRAHARALVAANQRGQTQRACAIRDSIPTTNEIPDTVPTRWSLFADLYTEAYIERLVTRGL